MAVAFLSGLGGAGQGWVWSGQTVSLGRAPETGDVAPVLAPVPRSTTTTSVSSGAPPGVPVTADVPVLATPVLELAPVLDPLSLLPPTFSVTVVLAVSAT